MMHRVIDPISIDGVRFEIGQTVDLDEATAAQLIELGCLVSEGGEVAQDAAADPASSDEITKEIASPKRKR